MVLGSKRLDAPVVANSDRTKENFHVQTQVKSFFLFLVKTFSNTLNFSFVKELSKKVWRSLVQIKILPTLLDLILIEF